MGKQQKQVRWADLLRDKSGNVLPIAVAGIVVMVALVGGGVDLSRAYKVQNRLQNACDAAVLAGRKAVTTHGYDDQAKAQAQSYFNINFDPQQQGTSHTVFLSQGDTAGNSIGGQASAQMPMLMMQMFGLDDMTLRANCASTMGVGNSDITMVLDVTGSMSQSLGGTSKIAALKTAMKNFYSTVDTATQGSNARVRYAVVPYSTTVNVGHLLYDLDPDYLTDAWTVQSRAPRTHVQTQTVFDHWDNPVLSSAPSDYTTLSDGSLTQVNSTNYSSMNACNTGLPANVPWANNGTAQTTTTTTTNGSGQQVVTTIVKQPQRMTTYVCQTSGNKIRRYYYYSNRTYNTYSYATSNPITKIINTTIFDGWDYKPVQYNTSQLKAFHSVSAPVGANGAMVSSTWAGCIEERKTDAASSFSFSNITGMSPSDALDVDIDSAPTTDPDTKWAPLWPAVAFERSGPAIESDTASYPLNYTTPVNYCVPAARALGVMSQSEFNSYADSLSPNGNTYLDIGMIWGARLSSPDGIFSDLVNEEPTNGGNVTRHIVFMTDGSMDTGSGSRTTDPVKVYSSWGNEHIDRRVTSDGNEGQSNARHSQRIRAVCDAIKAKGIRIWAIQFDTPTTLQGDLAYCASPNSGFTANNATQLDAAFQTIAKQVGELRVLS